MSDSVRPQRWQPTRLFRPWDSPGKNTGVGCHILLQCMRVKSESEVAQSCPISQSHGLQPTRFLHPWDFPSKNTGVGCHCLLRERKIFSPISRTEILLNLDNQNTLLSLNKAYLGLSGGHLCLVTADRAATDKDETRTEDQWSLVFY